MLTTNTAVATAAVMKNVEERYGRSHGLLVSSQTNGNKFCLRIERVRAGRKWLMDITTLASSLLWVGTDVAE